MRWKEKFTLILLFCMFVSSSVLYADVSIGGDLESETWLNFDDRKIHNNSNTVSLKFEYTDMNYHLLVSPKIETYGLPVVDERADLQNVEQIFDLSVGVSEAYIDIYEFLLPSLDIRIGKQIIVWGTADKINPTGNICPSDFSGTLEFGEKLGVNSILTSLYISDFIFSFAFIPVFTPSRLPKGDLLGSLIPEIPIPDAPAFTGTTRGTESHTIQNPDNVLSETSQFAAKLSTFVCGYDFSMSYYYGRYTVPIYYQIDYTVVGLFTNIQTYSRFPKVQIIGFDFAGSIFNMGLWGEAALFIPEKVMTDLYITNTPPIQIGSEITLDEEPYLRYVIGTDYTFSGGLYYNLQYVYGLDHEIGKDNLNHYFVLRMEKSYFYEKLKILPLTLILGVYTLDTIESNYGIGYVPEIQFFPSDNLELDLGIFITSGKGENLLARLDNHDSFFLTIKASF